MTRPADVTCLAGCLLATLALCGGVAVMSIDLGSEWIKVGVVSPGMPMDIALNRESKRKTPAAMAMRDGERTFGEDALTTGVRFPALTYQHLLPLVGKRLANPAVQRFQRRFPHYSLEEDPARGTVLFRHDTETVFSVEELLSMMLTQARQTASEHTQQTVTDAVITVPAFFSQAERRAVVTAAQLAGVKVLQLMNDNAAVALNYGMYRRSDFNGSTRHILFYDMGADNTAATLVGFQLVKTKERGFTETNPQLQILGYAFDRTLGGLEMTMRLRDHLAKVFSEKKKTKEDVYQSPRAMAKLLKEAERVKKILSANADTVAQVEGLLDEEDFRQVVTRAELEALCQDLSERVTAPLEAAVKSAGMELSLVDQLILVGAATRMPLVQDQLSARWGRELGKSVNTDEAAALGAVYRAADLSTGFKVMKFHVRDYVTLPVGVDFERDSEDAGEKTRRKVHRNLFTRGNPYPQKKVITFNRSQQDFGFVVNYGDLSHLSEEDVRVVDGLNLTYVLLDGVTDVYALHTGDGVDAKGLKVHFHMDDSGLLNLTGVEAVFEKTSGGGDDDDDDDQSTLSKLSNAFGKLFGVDENKDDEKDGKAEDAEQEAPGSEKEEKEAKKEEPQKEEERNKSSEKEANATAASKEEKPKIKVVKVPIKFKTTNLNVADLEGEAFEAAKQKIVALDKEDKQRKRREKARNALESYANDAATKLYEELYEQSSTEEERQVIRKAAGEISDWLYEDGFDESAAVFEEKLEEMKKLTKTLYERVEEHKSRAETVQALKDMLNATKHFLIQADLSVNETVIVESDVLTLKTMHNSTKEWLAAKEKEQAKTPLTDSPKLRMKAIAEKYLSLDREAKYVVNKIKAGAARKLREESDAKIKETMRKLEEEEKAKKAAEAAANLTEESSATDLSDGTSSTEAGDVAAADTDAVAEAAAEAAAGDAAGPDTEGAAQGTDEGAADGGASAGAEQPAADTAPSENHPESDKRKDVVSADKHQEL